MKEKKDASRKTSTLTEAAASQPAKVGQAAAEGGAAQVGPWIFKSKYKEDRITLKKPRKGEYADGTKFVEPGAFAEFSYNTWTTEDAELADILRKKIAAREKYAPLGVMETTVID